MVTVRGGTVKRLADTPRSYIVEGLSGQEYCRNHKHLRKAPTQLSTATSVNDDDVDVTEQPLDQPIVQ